MSNFYVDTNAYCMIGLKPKWFAATVRWVDTMKGVHLKVSVSKANTHTHTHSLLVALIHMATISVWYALYRMIISTKFIVIQVWGTKNVFAVFRHLLFSYPLGSCNRSLSLS